MLNDYLAFETDGVSVYLGSNLDVLPFMADNSVDSIVTDPPYELGFMGKSWDSSGIAYSVDLWRECLRVLKPGGHLLAFSGSRTYHRMTVAIEDAGFDVRDMIAWISNKTFPKSHNIGKAIDKAAGVEVKVGKAFKVAGEYGGRELRDPDTQGNDRNEMRHDAQTDEAKKWAGWGTALKPTVEPVVMARKPLVGTVAENVLLWGVGGLNIDASRIRMSAEDEKASANNWKPQGYELKDNIYELGSKIIATEQNTQGRWPANIVLDEFTAGLLDEQSGFSKSTGVINRWTNGAKPFGNGAGNPYESVQGIADSGGASRFFYVAKANKRDRNEGLDEISNTHPTVKPTELMRYLIKLVTPAGGVVLDPFTGSGSTGKAALLDGYKFVGIELTAEYLPIIEGRIKYAADKAKESNDEGKLF